MSDDTKRRLDLLRRVVEYDRYCKTIEYEDYDQHSEVPNPIDSITRLELSDLVYLVDHRCIKPGCYTRTMGHTIIPHNPVEPTARGIDVVSDDGGLTVYQERMVLDIETEAFRKMLLEVVEKTHDDQPEKKSLTDKIKTATSAGLRSIAGAVLKQAADGSVKAIPWHDIFVHLV